MSFVCVKSYIFGFGYFVQYFRLERMSPKRTLSHVSQQIAMVEMTAQTYRKHCIARKNSTLELQLQLKP